VEENVIELQNTKRNWRTRSSARTTAWFAICSTKTSNSCFR